MEETMSAISTTVYTNTTNPMLINGYKIKVTYTHGRRMIDCIREAAEKMAQKQQILK